MIITRELLCPKNRVCNDPGFTFNPRIVFGSAAFSVLTLLISVRAGLLPPFLSSSLSTRNTRSSKLSPFPGVPYASPPVGVR